MFNKNNPSRQLQLASEVIIKKKANYQDAVTCHCCIAENCYKVYVSQHDNSDEEDVPVMNLDKREDTDEEIGTLQPPRLIPGSN